jgi:hypothetical protein
MPPLLIPAQNFSTSADMEHYGDGAGHDVPVQKVPQPEFDLREKFHAMKKELRSPTSSHFSNTAPCHHERPKQPKHLDSKHPTMGLDAEGDVLGSQRRGFPAFQYR